LRVHARALASERQYPGLRHNVITAGAAITLLGHTQGNDKVPYRRLSAMLCF
jgi:hypothetical protein